MKSITVIIIYLWIIGSRLSAQIQVDAHAQVDSNTRKLYTLADSLPADFKTLVNFLPAFIDTGLTQRMYILPIACALMNEGGIMLIGPSSILDRFRKPNTESEFYFDANIVVPLPDYSIPDSAIHSKLTDTILNVISGVKDKLRATAVCMSARVKTPQGNIDLVAINLDHKGGPSMNFLLPYERFEDHSFRYSKPILQNAPSLIFNKK